MRTHCYIGHLVLLVCQFLGFAIGLCVRHGSRRSLVVIQVMLRKVLDIVKPQLSGHTILILLILRVRPACYCEHQVLQSIFGHLGSHLCEFYDTSRESLRELGIGSEEVLVAVSREYLW